VKKKFKVVTTVASSINIEIGSEEELFDRRELGDTRANDSYLLALMDAVTVY